MAVDWSKYGVKEKSKTSVDWDKYKPIKPVNPDILPLITSSATAEPSELIANATSRLQAPAPAEEERSLGGKALDTVKAIGRGLSDFERKFTDSISFGLSPYLSEKIAKSGALPEKFAQDELARMERAESSVGGKIGEFAGYVMPGTAIEKGIAMAAKPLIGAVPKLGARVGTSAAAGATEAAAQELGDTAFRGGSFDPENVALGAGIGGAFPLVGKGASAIIQKYRSKPQSSQVLSLPEGRTRGNVNQAVTDDIITPEYTFKLDEASPQTRQATQTVQEAWNDLSKIDDEIKSLNIRKEEAVNDQFKLLSEQLKNRQGVVGKGVIRGDDGYVKGSTKGFSMNPEWYQEFYSVNRRPPNRKELYQIAKDQIENGYVDGGVQIPNWRVQNQFDETIQALEEVRGTIRNTLRNEGLGITDAQLKSSEVRLSPAKRATEPDEIRSISVPQAADDLIQTKEPRIRDKVVSYLDEQEKAARERLKAKRTTLSSNPIDQYADYAIIGASKIAKGTVKFADWSEQMVKEFGESIKPHLQKIYDESANRVRNVSRRLSSANDNINRTNSAKVNAVDDELTLYHGSDAVFDTFRTSKAQAGEGVFLTDNADAAKEYGKNIYSVKVHPRNMATDTEWNNAFDELEEEHLSKLRRLEDDLDDGRISEADYDKASKEWIVGETANLEQNAKVSARLREQGYDAYVGNMQSGDAGKEYLILDPSIIKSNKLGVDEPSRNVQKSGSDNIQSRAYEFLDEMESKARERLSKKRNTLSSNPIDQYADYAIIGAAKLGKGVIKFSEWSEQMLKEFGEEIKPHLRAIYDRSENIIKETERRASKEAQEVRAFNNADSGDATTFRSKVNRDTKSSKVPFAERWEKLRTQFTDDLAPLEGLEKRVRGSLSSAEDSLYKSARLFRGVPEKANAIVRDKLAPIVEGIEKQGYTSADLGDYALAVHARDVNNLDMKSGWTNKEINSVIRKFSTPEMERARKEMIRISDDLLVELEKSGVITSESIKVMREKYPNYMPLFRSFDDESVNFSDGLSKALANVTTPIKKLKGSERKVDDPFINMVKNIFQSTNAAERNKVALQLSKLAKDDVDSNFIRKLDDGEEVGRKNVVTVLEGGQKVRYEVEPEVYKAMLNLDQESSNMLIRVLQKPASLLRAGATLTPEFSLRNPLRDIVQAFVVSESGFNPLIDFPVGLIQSISKGDLYKKWVDELGAYGNIMSNDRNLHKEVLERVLKEPPSKKFVNIVSGRSMIRLLRAISDTTESATKVGEFRAALRKGASPQEAAYRSRDIMDFGRAGTSIRQTNKIVAFLNANIQGKSKLIRAFKRNPAGFSARAFASVTVPTISAFLMQKYMANDAQKQTIEESPAWMTDTFWLIPIPNTDQVARIPKPFDLSTLFSNLPERALRYTYNNDKKAFDGFAKKAMADASMPGMITGLLPFIEGMANYSFFQGRNIIPRGEEGRKYEDQYDINTTETAKFLARGAEKLTGGEGTFKNFSSPRIMDNTIKGLTAGLGTYATSAIDVMLDKFNMTNNPVKPEKSPAQQPLSRAFLVNPLQGGKSTEELYELKEKLTREKGSSKLNRVPFKDNARLNAINAATEKMSSITKRVRQIENSQTMTAAEKRVQIEKLVRQRNQIARDTMKRLEPTR